MPGPSFRHEEKIITKKDLTVNFENHKYVAAVEERTWKDKVKNKITESKDVVSNRMSMAWSRTKNSKQADAISSFVDGIKLRADERFGNKYRSCKKVLSKHVIDLKDDAREICFWKMAVSEVFGSSFFVLLVGGSSFKASREQDKVVNMALCSGFCYVALVLCFGGGGHFNSSLTVGMACARQIRGRYVAVHLACQLGGNLCGAILLNWVSSSSSAYIGITRIVEGVSNMKALLVEILSTFTFVLATLFSFFRIKERKKQVTGALVVGCALIATSLFGIPYTGGSMNATRSLGTAIASNFWSSQWVYLTGPTIGGMLAGWLFYLMTNDVIARTKEKCREWIERRKRPSPRKDSKDSSIVVDVTLANKMFRLNEMVELDSFNAMPDVESIEQHDDNKSDKESENRSDSDSSDEYSDSGSVIKCELRPSSKVVRWSPSVEFAQSEKQPEKVFAEDSDDFDNCVFVYMQDPITENGSPLIVGEMRIKITSPDEISNDSVEILNGDLQEYQQEGETSKETRDVNNEIDFLK